MEISFWRRLWKRTIFRVLLIVIAVILIVAFFVNRYFTPILTDKVKSTVLSSSDSLYRIDFSDVRLHILEGRIILYNVSLTPDTSVYNQKRKLGLEPDNLYQLHIKKLVIKHVHPFKLYFKHKLDIAQIIVSAPELHVIHRPNEQRDTARKDNRTIYQKISKTLKLVHAGQILLNDVKLRFVDYNKGKKSISVLNDVNLDAEDLRIDSATQFDKKRFMFCHEVQIELNNYAGKSSNGLYHYTFKRLNFSTLTHRINAYGFNLASTYKPSKFFEKTYRGRFTAYLDSLQINNFDIDLYNRTHKIKATSMALTYGGIKVFGNPRVDPGNINKDRIATYPNVGIFLLHADFMLDTLKVQGIDVTYEELNRKSQKTGYVTFNNTHGHFLNVTTDSAALNKNNITTIQLYSSLMNRGKLDLMMRFNLRDKEHSFNYKGTLGPMDLTAMNVATMPLALLKVNTGQVTRFDFAIAGNRAESHGTVSLQYNNLKITVLKADTAEKRLKHKMLESFYANLILLKRNNPDNPGDTPRSFSVSFKRPIDYPFFKAAWNTLLIGIKSSVGMDKKAQEKAAQKMADRDRKKVERKERKAMRKQKRAERKRKRAEKKRLKAMEKAQEKQSRN